MNSLLGSLLLAIANRQHQLTLVQACDTCCMQKLQGNCTVWFHWWNRQVSKCFLKTRKDNMPTTVRSTYGLPQHYNSTFVHIYHW